MDSQRKAWRVEWPSDDSGVDIVLAATADDARRLAETYGDEPEWVDIRATRAPQFDGCKTTAELMRAQLGAGWQFGCSDCEHRVDADGCCQCDDDAEDTRERAPVVDGSEVFCDAACYLAYYAERGRSAGNRLGACLDAVEKWPGITIAGSNGCEYALDADVLASHPVGGVSFRFPGGGGCVIRWTRGSAAIRVPANMAAWERFAAECRRQKGSGDSDE